MSGSLIRAIILTVVVGLFIYQARQAGARSRKQRAFGLAAVAVGLFALLNIFDVLGANVAPLALPFRTLGVLLMLVSAIFLVQGWRKGEMDEQVAQVRKAMDNERTRHKQNDKQD